MLPPQRSPGFLVSISSAVNPVFFSTALLAYIMLPLGSVIITGLSIKSNPLRNGCIWRRYSRIVFSSIGFRYGIQFVLYQKPRRNDTAGFKDFTFWFFLRRHGFQLPRFAGATARRTNRRPFPVWRDCPVRLPSPFPGRRWCRPGKLSIIGVPPKQ